MNIVYIPFERRSTLKGKIRLHVGSYSFHSSIPVFGRGSTCKKDNGGSQLSFPLYEMVDICQLQSVPLIDTVLKFDRTGDFL